MNTPRGRCASSTSCSRASAAASGAELDPFGFAIARMSGKGHSRAWGGWGALLAVMRGPNSRVNENERLLVLVLGESPGPREV